MLCSALSVWQLLKYSQIAVGFSIEQTGPSFIMSATQVTTEVRTELNRHCYSQKMD